MVGHRIIVRVSPDGEVKVSVEGLSGASCADATRAVERALGATTADAKTAEFNKVAAQGPQVRQGGVS